MRCLEPLVMLESLLGWCLGTNRSGMWLQYIWLPRNLAGAAWRPSEETKTEASEPSASLLQLQLSLPGCEGSEPFHTDLCNGTDAFVPKLPV